MRESIREIGMNQLFSPVVKSVVMSVILAASGPVFFLETRYDAM